MPFFCTATSSHTFSPLASILKEGKKKFFAYRLEDVGSRARFFLFLPFPPCHVPNPTTLHPFSDGQGTAQREAKINGQEEEKWVWDLGNLSLKLSSLPPSAFFREASPPSIYLGKRVTFVPRLGKFGWVLRDLGIQQTFTTMAYPTLRTSSRPGGRSRVSLFKREMSRRVLFEERRKKNPRSIVHFLFLPKLLMQQDGGVADTQN